MSNNYTKVVGCLSLIRVRFMRILCIYEDICLLPRFCNLYIVFEMTRFLDTFQW